MSTSVFSPSFWVYPDALLPRDAPHACIIPIKCLKDIRIGRLIGVLKVIKEKRRIRKAQKDLGKAMREQTERNGTITIGGKGFHGPKRVSWSEQLGIWWTTYPLHNRYENAFGVEEPRWGTKYGHSIPCVVNVPFEGINRRIGGAFAVDGDDKVYLMHRGRIGGGRSGIGKSLFVENFRGKWKTVQDGDVLSNLALIGTLNNSDLPYQVAHFVKEVQRIKGETGETKPDIQLPHIFKEEFSGKRKYSIGEVEAECNHGRVVSNLEGRLRSMGLLAGNKHPMDLYILDPSDRIAVLFEIKTDSTSTSCYEAIGQLLFYATKLTREPLLVAVFPDSLDRQYIDAFNEIGLQSLTYRWVANEPFFDEHQIAELLSCAHISD